jgi:hypothetical protein
MNGAATDFGYDAGPSSSSGRRRDRRLHHPVASSRPTADLLSG